MRDGLVAEFDGPHTFECAFVRLQELGYTRLESWSPYPVRGVVTRLPESIVPWIMLGSGLVGACLAYLVQWWCNAYDYPLDVGGRPYDSIPAYIPITFESGVLAAALLQQPPPDLPDERLGRTIAADVAARPHARQPPLRAG